jgi:hypothetical protein
MTQWVDASPKFSPLKHGRLYRKVFAHTIPGTAVLVSSVLFGVWTLYVRPPAQHSVVVPPASPAASAAQTPYGALFDPGFISGSAPISLMQSFPLEASLEPMAPPPSAAAEKPENAVPLPVPASPRLSENIPLPVPRPGALDVLERRSPSPAPAARIAQQSRKTALPAAPVDNRSFFERLFGVTQPSGPALAYAAPESGVLSNLRSMTSRAQPQYDRWTAVYDVAAHTVYLPDGTRLEAHSGLRDRLDDPRYVHERMRGPTPPNIYQLTLREQLFHGVQALRLTPIGNGNTYGRTGLLAHTYMLGPNGDSNGCVAFRDYNAFLRAYQRGDIKRLAVVARSN